MKDISKTVTQDFKIKRGDTFYFNFQIQDCEGNGIDLSAFSGGSALMQFKENELTESVLDLSTTGGSINLDNVAAGQIILSAGTETLVENRYYYDLELSKNNFKRTVMSGRIFVDDDYSK